MASAEQLQARITNLENIYRNTFFEGEIVKITKVSPGDTFLSLSVDLGTDFADVEVYLPRVDRTVLVENAILVDSRITRNNFGIALTEFDYQERMEIPERGLREGSRVLLLCSRGNFRDEVYVLARLGL